MARVRRFWVRPSPYEYLVVVNLRIIPVLERERKVRVEFQPRFVGEPVDPSLGVWLSALDWAHVVRFSVIYSGIHRRSKL